MRCGQLLQLLLIGVVAVGFFRGWWLLSTDRESNGKKINIHLTIDREKLNDDSELLKVKLSELRERTNKQ